MPKKFLGIAGGLIALYLIVAYSKGTKDLITSGTAGGANVIKAFQGRN